MCFEWTERLLLQRYCVGMDGESAAPGWYPTDDGREGYWDGDQWTEFRKPQDRGPGLLRRTASEAASRVVSTKPELPEGTIWSAIGKPITGIGAGRYRLDERFLYFEKGTLRTDSQQVPIDQVMDVDVQQSMTQKARGVFTVTVHIQRAQGIEKVQMIDIPDGRSAQTIINDSAHAARARLQQARNTMKYETSSAFSPPGVAGATTPASSSADPIEQLAQLGKLRDAGVLTEEEFAAKKTDILSRM